MSAETIECIADAPHPLTAALATLLDHHRRRLASSDRDALLDLVTASERALAMVHAFQLEAVAALDARPVAGIRPGSTDDPTCDELQCELRVTVGVAHQLLDLARDLRRRLPGTARLLATGAISIWHARRMAERTEHLTGDQCLEVEERVLPKASARTTPRFTDSIRRALMHVDPIGTEQRRERNVRERKVTVRPADPDQDGMSILWALLPDADARTCLTAVDRYARTRTDPGDVRTLDQRRADALTAICQAWLDGAHVTGRPAGPAIQVTITLDALLGRTAEPAHLAGSGPITARAAREIGARAGARFTRHVLDPATGGLVRLDPVTYRSPGDLVAHATDPVDPPRHSPGCRSGTGGDRYRPTATQRRLVRARDPVCTFPYCRRPAIADDLDHADEHARSGTTCHCGLHPLCRHHHNAKTRAVWHVEHHPDGSVTWTGPTGRTYHVPPHDHRDD